MIFIVGDKTASKTAGSCCKRMSQEWFNCTCTPYKQNVNGTTTCKMYSASPMGLDVKDIGNINPYSYVEHKFREAIIRKKDIIILYNSVINRSSWLPMYVKGYECYAHSF